MVRGDRLVAAKNAEYWQDGLPHLDEISIRFLTDQQTGLNTLTAGEADFHLRRSNPDVGGEARRAGDRRACRPGRCGSRTATSTSPSRRSTTPGCGAPPREPGDRPEAFNEGYTLGLGEPAVQAFPATYYAHQDDLDDAYPYDPEQARELLAEAGYADGVAIKAIAGSASSETLKSEIVQAMLAEVGIDMTFEVMEVGPATSTFFVDLGHDLYCAGWTGRPDASQTANSLFGPESFYNAGKYEAPGMVDALAASSVDTDLEARAARSTTSSTSPSRKRCSSR